MSENGSCTKTGKLKSTLAMLLVPLLAVAVTAEARASIDDEVAQRIAAIEEVIERLEFDAGRINEPAAFREAIDAFTGSVCAALTASTDIDFTWTPIDESLMGEGETESPSPVDVVGASVFGEAKKDYGAKVGLSIISDHSSGITHRLCINLVPWAVYAYYRVRSEVPGEAEFPEIVPNEVFLESQNAGATPVEMRQAARIEGGWDGLSPDALAFLEAIGAVVLEGLEGGAGGSDGLPWTSSRIDDVADVLGLSVNGVVSAASGLAEAVPINASIFSEGASIGELFSAFVSFPERVASQLPFAPSMDWLPQNPFGFDSLSDVDYCASLDVHGPVSEIPYLNEMLDTSCEMLGLIESGASQLVTAGADFVDMVVPEQAGLLDEIASELQGMEDLVSAYGPTVKQFYHEVIGFIGDKAYGVSVRVKDFADELLDFINI